MIARILTKHRFTVREATNGREALEAVNQKLPELILLDILMPEVDGITVLKELRRSYTTAELPILLVTAMQESEDIVNGLKLGANDYLPKKFNAEELFARVSTALQIRNYHLQLKERNNIMERDLDIARLIQKKLLPKEPPQLPGIQFETLYVPMDKVGGDYYDFFPKHNSLDIFIADVSGHGIPGAFLASVLKMSSQFYQKEEMPLNTMMAMLDEAVYERGALGMFATAFWLRIYPESRKIQYSNAGHSPLLLHRRHKQEFIELATPGSPLGINYEMKKRAPFQMGEFTVEPGDRLILYTDGIIETVNEHIQAYEDVLWKKFLHDHANTPLNELSANLLDSLRSFSGSNTFNDDVTWVVMDILQ